MILQDKIILNKKFNATLCRNILLNHIEDLHNKDIIKYYKSVKLIERIDSDNIVQTTREIIIKDILPQFILDIIPKNLKNNLTKYTEYTIWEETQWSFEYKNINEKQLYTLDGTCKITDDNTISISLELNIIENIPLKESVEKKVLHMIIQKWKKTIKGLEEIDLSLII
jgi:hypothetical protein